MAQQKRAAGKRKTSAATASKNKKNKKKQDYFIYHIVISSLVSVFLGIFLYTGGDAIVNEFIRNSLYGLFGATAYIVPLSLAATTAYLLYTKNVKRYWIKFILATLALCNLSAIIHLITAKELGDIATSVGNGGLIGAAVSITVVRLVQKIAAYVILFITLFALLGAISGVSTVKTLVMYARKAGAWFKDAYVELRESCKDNYEYYEDDFEELPVEQEEAPKHRSRRRAETETDPSMAAANDFAADAQGFNANLDFPDLSNGIDEIFSNHEQIEDEISEPILDLPVGDIASAPSDMFNFEPVPETKANDIIQSVNDAMEGAIQDRSKERSKKISEEEKEQFNKEFDEAIENEPVPYVFPPLSLLSKTAAASRDQRSELRSTAEKLISVLDSFGVKARLLQVTQGPSVTRYEIQPDTGTKLSKISGLSEDLALNLAVSSVLVAAVPGKAAVGIEIPNKKINAVGLHELLSSSEFKNSKSKLTFALGKDIGGNVVVGDIAKMPHMLIAGATGSGKSVCINTLILSILYNASPQEVKLIMVDPKRVELGGYNGIPHLLVPVVTDPKKAAGALNWAVSEMMRRYDLFNETNTRKLESYNKLMKSTGGEELPQIVIIIDELADLMMVAAKEVETYICRLAQLARAAGIHLVIATQRPSVDVVTGLIKANIPSRIALAVSQQVDSRTILDHSGAEKLLGKGDMLYHPAGEREARRVQGAYVPDNEIESVLNFIKETSGNSTHYSEDLAEQIERVATGENGVTPDVEEDGDVLLNDAINLAIELGKISTSMIQRRLSIGYSRAGRIIDQMEQRGIISGPNGSKPREVLVSSQMTSGGGDYETGE